MKIEAQQRIAASTKGWIGVDLDGTLAYYDEWRGELHIGAPIPAMVQRVKQWLAEGKDVRILTARVAGGIWKQPDHPVMKAINRWCLMHIGQVLNVTSEKDPLMEELWDDRAVQVVKNTGQKIGAAHRLKAAVGNDAVIESIEDKIQHLTDRQADADDAEKERIKRRITRLQDEIKHYQQKEKS